MGKAGRFPVISYVKSVVLGDQKRCLGSFILTLCSVTRSALVARIV